jgi:hypothetical protein
MTRHQRRKAARARKDAKGELLNSRALHVLQQAKLKANLMERKAKRSPKGLGNRGIYSGMGLYPAPGYGTGAFKEKPLSERQCREHRALDKQR